MRLRKTKNGRPVEGAGAPRRRFSLLRRTARLNREGGLQDAPLVVAAGLVDDVDRLTAFGPAILAVRWGTSVLSTALAAEAFIHAEWNTVAWCGAIIAYTLFRTAHPLRYYGDTKSLIRVLAELVLPMLAVINTGYWDSPYVFSILTAVTIAGFARGFAFGLRLAGVAAAAVSIPALAEAGYDNDALRLSAQWAAILLLVALVAGYGRRISGEADRQHSVALERLGRLADANTLLFSLHRVAQSLPASFDLDEVLDTTLNRLRDLFDSDAVAILLLDDTDSLWTVMRRHGVRLPEAIPHEDLCPPLREVVGSGEVFGAPNLLVGGGPGLAPSMGSGLYAPLRARGATIGLVAIEHGTPHRYTQRDVELLGGFVEPAALAIDNARWFARLRTVGADEERTRIARDLHDRIGQSLAYLAFELDRIVDNHEHGEAAEDLSASLDQLRNDVRGVIGEVRDTLYDLRTDVSDEQAIAPVLESFAKRLAERSGLQIDVHCDQEARLPLLQEREMWRIAQEALVNVERHAEATQARVVWRCNGKSAALEVLDNGKGFPVGKAGRLDSYGILGMRERASSIGATVEVASASGRGTRVRCLLQQGN
ncbi:MAG TPA: GAF domain-containing sensor histidine kinase [Acidimicrobiales bacterium]|nr:GAF domain-containing sensor histidine kinase [Acidimicrobiales bacterium]